MSSNAHRAHESADGTDNMRDDVDEAIILTQVCMYVPTGLARCHDRCYMFVCMHVCMYVCMYVCLYGYTQVSLYVSEYVPTGVNAMVTLNDRLGAMDRCQVMRVLCEYAVSMYRIHISAGRW